MIDNVHRGIELLDQQVPDWRERIDWDRLRMGHGCACVLGQLYGSYFNGIEWLQITGQDYGFDVSWMKPTFDDYRRLTDLWRQEANAAGAEG